MPSANFKRQPSRSDSHRRNFDVKRKKQPISHSSFYALSVTPWFHKQVALFSIFNQLGPSHLGAAIWDLAIWVPGPERSADERGAAEGVKARACVFLFVWLGQTPRK